LLTLARSAGDGGQLVGPITLPGLQYDTTYYIGVVGLDDEYARNQSLLLAGLRCTLGPTPVVNSAIADEVLLTVTVDVDLFNTRTGHSIKWQARIAEDAGFSVNVTTNGVKTTINPTDTDVFTGRSAGKTYYTQARTINQAGAPSPWSPTKVAVFRNGIPVMTAIPSTDVFPSSITARWDNSSVPNGYKLQAQADATESDLPNGNPTGVFDFTSGGLRTTPAFSSYSFNSGMTPNTTYFIQVESFYPAGGIVGTAPYVSAMTGVPFPTLTVANVYITSVTYTITESGVPNTHRYFVELSTTSNFSSGVATAAVSNFGAADEIRNLDLVNLIGNTTYYSRLTAFNHVNWQSPTTNPGPSFITRPSSVPFLTPVTLTPTESETQVKFAWGLGNNTQANTRFKVTLSSAVDFSLNPDVVTVGPGVFANQFTLNAGLPLISNNTYYAKVEVVDADAGRAQLSAAVTASTVTKPIQPQSLSFVEVTTGSVHLQWTGDSVALPGSKNSATTLYSAWIGNGGNPFVRQIGPGTILDAQFIHANLPLANNVLPNTTYLFTIVAKGVGGWADEVIAQSTVTKARQPALTIFGVTSTNTIQVDVFPFSPANPSDSLYTYECFYASDVAHLNVADTIVSTDQEVFFTGLQSNNNYDFHAKITDHAGRDTLFSNFVNGKTFAVPPVITPFVLADLTTGTARVNWSLNGNSSESTFRLSVDGSLVWTGTGTYSVADITAPVPAFKNVPNSTHTFRLDTVSVVGGQPAQFSTISTCTLANVPLPAQPNRTILASRVQFTLLNSNNPDYTQFAILLRSTDGVNVNYFDDPFAVADPSIEKMAFPNQPSPKWHTLGEWAKFIAGSTYTFTADGLPVDSKTYELVLYARNKNGIETAGSLPLTVALQSGYPEVSLTMPTGEVFVATNSYAVPIYTNETLLKFRALGSGHFNARVTEDVAISTPEALNLLSPNVYKLWTGWNGTILPFPAGVTATNSFPDPFYADPWSEFDFQTEGLWFFNIAGTLSDLGTPANTYISTSPFRVFIDTTPVDPGTIRAEFGQDATGTPDHTEILPGLPTGHQKPEFFWTKTDTQGKPNPRSPIVGWSWSFSSNPVDTPVLSSAQPQFLPASLFVAASSASYRVFMATYIANFDLVFESTFYFKVAALDKAGNWTPIPSEFQYNYVKDQVPPDLLGFDFPGVEVWTSSPTRYEAVNSTVPVQVIFSELMNFVGGDQAMSIVQTQDHLGNPMGTTIPYTVAWVELPTGTSAVLTPSLPGNQWPTGSRFVLHIDGFFTRDLAGNRLNVNYDVLFNTAMDPAIVNIGKSEDGNTTVTFQPGAFGPNPAGAAIADNPATRPVSAAPGLAGTVRKAVETIVKTKGGDYRKILSIKQFELYDLNRQALKTPFNGQVLLTFQYNDVNDNGIVDETEAKFPVKVKDLAIHWLDEKSGAWIKLPESNVDTAAKTVSIPLQHFSVYALIGAPSLDLSNAHPFPVPYKASTDPAGITFTGLSSIATVKIFTLDGRLVKTLTDDSGAGFVRWDPVNNESGDPVASDVYLYVIENDQQRRIGKLMVIR
ncbi:MAG TPA: T9SS type A sorting domain-containing protein, partial [Elusimicrobiota bacterium]|nr:T9SS type A sorting domain-containing protein [Elusimicrobiota bacterium]